MKISTATNSTKQAVTMQPIFDGPGIFGLFWKIPVMIQNTQTAFFSKIEQNEEKINAKIKVLSGVPAIAYSAMALIKFSLQDVSYVYNLTKCPGLHAVIPALFPWMAGIGLIVCVAETAFNALQLRRTSPSNRLSILIQYPEKGKKLKQSEKVEALSTILRNLQSTYYEDTKGRNKLALRLQPWCEEKIYEELKPILRKLASRLEFEQKEGILEAEDLIKTMKTQLDKARFFNITSILCLAICATGFIASLAGFPHIGIVLLILLGGCASLGLSVYSNSVLPEEGWHSNKTYIIRYFLDNWTNKYLFKIDFQKEEKHIEAAKNSSDYKSTLQEAEQIQHSYHKAKALFRALTQAIDERQDSEVLNKLALRIEKLSIFYGHKAKDSIPFE